MAFFRRRKVRKEAKEVLRHARHLRHMRGDVMSEAELKRLDEAREALRLAARGADIESAAGQTRELHRLLGRLTPQRPLPAARENVEVIVVAIAVAMAFRTYFIQPFKIPTGSMQPTLYGITSVDRAEPGLTDRYPLNLVKWAITGEWYRQVRVREGGTLAVLLGNGLYTSDPAMAREPYLYTDPNYPGDLYYVVAGRRYRVPRTARVNFPLGHQVRRGDVLWAGSRTAGDHVFVNKVRWNVRSPRRGEVMVFSTRGIEELERGLPRDRRGDPMSTHYIKRMAGLPGEHIGVADPALVVNGSAVEAPRGIARIAHREPGYAGYTHGGAWWADGMLFEGRTIPGMRLGDDEYCALGDNTYNSRDSRYWGPVPARNLVGPACFIYWPFVRASAPPAREATEPVGSWRTGWQFGLIR